MVDQMQISRRSILAGAALAGALAPVLATTSAWGQGAMRKASAAEIAALPRQKVEWWTLPSCTPTPRLPRVAQR